MSDPNEKIQGELPEPPPRGVRAMALVRWALLVAVALVAARSVWSQWGPSPPVAHRDDRYYCPMHPQMRSPDPGECPICHMNLEPIPAGRAPSPADAGPPSGVNTVTLDPDRVQAAGVTTAPAVLRESAHELRAPAVIEAPESALAQVHVRAPGFVERVSVRETGVRVSRGQPLAWVYSPQIYQAEQELLTASRWAGTAPPGGAAGATGDLVAAARRALELLGLSAADIDTVIRTGSPMRDVPLRAPAAGYITRFNAPLGTYAAPENTLYEIADLSRVWVVASVYERDVASVRRGMDARFLPRGVGSAPVEARVDLVEPEVNAQTRTARVRLTVRNPGLALRPGDYGEVAFALPAERVLAVPRDALVDTGTRQYLYVDAGGGRFEPREVRAGAALDDGSIQVLSGLREGERVVVRGNFMIDSESRLRAGASADTPGGMSDAGARP